MEHRLETPIDKEKLQALRAGDMVYLSGTVYTARDAEIGRASCRERV